MFCNSPERKILYPLSRLLHRLSEAKMLDKSIIFHKECLSSLFQLFSTLNEMDLLCELATSMANSCSSANEQSLLYSSPVKKFIFRLLETDLPKVNLTVKYLEN
jgi:hypothetical protein